MAVHVAIRCMRLILFLPCALQLIRAYIYIRLVSGDRMILMDLLFAGKAINRPNLSGPHVLYYGVLANGQIFLNIQGYLFNIAPDLLRKRA